MLSFLTVGVTALNLVACGGGRGVAPGLSHPNTLRVQDLSQTSQKSYTVTDLGTFGGTQSFPNGGITGTGAVAGFSTLPGDTVTRSFLWQNGRMIDLGSLPAGPNSYANGIDESLQIVGAADGAASTPDNNGSCFAASPQFEPHAYLWQNGVMTDLGTLGGKGSAAFWINITGQIVGVSQIKRTDPYGAIFCGSSGGGQIIRSFVLENGKMVDIGTLGGFDAAAIYINNDGQITGPSQVRTRIDPTLGFVPTHAYLWVNGAMRDLGTLGGGLSEGHAVNEQSTVVGYSSLLGEQHQHAFLWHGGTMKDLGTVGGDTDSNASDINNVGQIVGISGSANYTTSRAFLWQNGVMTDLNTMISNSAGVQLASGFFINDAGQITAAALVQHTGQMHAVLLTPTDATVQGQSRNVRITARLRKFLFRGFRP
jgi:probable HAF family extracellular repeat protein